MYDIRLSGKEGQITCTTLGELNEGTPCVVEINGNNGKVTFKAEWGGKEIAVSTHNDTFNTVAVLTWEEVRALAEALGLAVHVATRP